MSKYTCLYQVGGVIILFVSEDIQCEEFFLHSQHWIPSLKKLTRHPRHIHVRIDAGVGSNRLIYQKDGFILRGSYERYQLLMDVVLLLSKYLEYELNKKNSFSIHSSCLAVNNTAYLLLGPSSSGKTITAAKCNEQCPDIRILSGERTIIKNNAVIGGTTTLYFRNGSILHDLPSLKEGVDLTGNVWKKKTTVAYPDNVFPGRYPIAGLILLQINRDELFHSLFDGPDKFWQIYQHMAHFSDVFPLVVAGQMKPLPYFHEQMVVKRRIKATRDLCNNIPLYTLSGSLKAVTAILIGQLKGEQCL